MTLSGEFIRDFKTGTDPIIFKSCYEYLFRTYNVFFKIKRLIINYIKQFLTS